MRASVRFIALVILAFGILSVVPVIRSQDTAARNVWEYASVHRTTVKEPTGPGGEYAARICYAIPQGCRSEVVTISKLDDPYHVVSASLFAAAASKLGEQGWELTTATFSEKADAVLYFRRQKSK